MTSLVQLPKVVGFFSYSRNDDEGDNGAVSALANRFFLELRAQLGRNNENFKLWRDKDALAAGEHWKEKLKEAVSESVFFIQTVTPSAVNSEFCRFEFQSFLQREKELGRDDLVFPVLYISIHELDAKPETTDPVISVIKDRHYEDWRPIRYRDVNSTEVRQTVGNFCSTVSKKLRLPWISPEERQAIEGQRRIEEQCRIQENKAQRRAEDEQREKLARARRQAEEESLAEIAQAEEKARQQQRELHKVPVGQRKRINRPRTIAVTGTMDANTSRLKRRIETLLDPYVEENTIWYCGGRGTTDELVLEYLIRQGVHPLVVGYQRYDFSPIVKKMAEESKVTLIDATTENVSQLVEAPSERDMFFASKADMVILFWDRDSVGTKRLIDFFTKNGTNMLLGFI